MCPFGRGSIRQGVSLDVAVLGGNHFYVKILYRPTALAFVEGLELGVGNAPGFELLLDPKCGLVVIGCTHQPGAVYVGQLAQGVQDLGVADGFLVDGGEDGVVGLGSHLLENK